jgi:MscS family membrane protein
MASNRLLLLVSPVARGMQRALLALLVAVCVAALPLAVPAARAEASGAAIATGPTAVTAADAQAAPAAEAAAKPPERNRLTPRNAAYSFIVLGREGNWVDASALLLEPEAGWPEGASPERLARALKSLLDEHLWLDFDAIPSLPAVRTPNAPTPRVEIGSIAFDTGTIPVSLVPHSGQWFISAETVALVPAAARDLGVWWVSGMPSFLVDVRLFEIALWQWIGLLAIGLVGVLIGVSVARALKRGADLGAGRGLGAITASVAAIAPPISVLLSLVAMQIAEQFLALSAPARENLALGSRAATALVIAWAAVRWIRAMSAILEQQLVERGVAEAVGIVRIARMVAAILIYLLGVSAALQIFGLDLSAVIAGLGIGTAALALASQQTLGNLFGGASVLADRALTPGDTVNLGGTIATVERIGIRSTQLRTLDRTLLIVANGDLAQSRIEKMSARDGFRLNATLGLRYETTAAQMRAIVADIRTLLEDDAMVDRESVRVHFLLFNNSSLDIDIKGLIKTEDAAQYRATLERFNLSFMEIVARHGSGFAFPSQTVYLARDSAPRG